MSERRELRDLLANGTPTEPEMARAAAAHRSAAAVARCTESFAALRRSTPRSRALGAADLDHGVRAELVELAHFVVERQS